jgi:rhodanese-related sulfurtransferase
LARDWPLATTRPSGGPVGSIVARDHGIAVAYLVSMQRIEREQLKQMMDRGEPFTLVEVLAPEAFKNFHLPNAINVPIDASDFDDRIQTNAPNKAQPVVVYCADIDCNASPKAAQRLEELGYSQVYDYAAGKEDWKEANLPIEP